MGTEYDANKSHSQRRRDYDTIRLTSADDAEAARGRRWRAGGRRWRGRGRPRVRWARVASRSVHWPSSAEFSLTWNLLEQIWDYTAL